MDFGLMGLEGLEGPDAGRREATGKVGDRSGSASAKQQRSWPADDDWRTLKIRRLTTQFLHYPLCDFKIIEKNGQEVLRRWQLEMQWNLR
ncbi:hypothetical protein ACFX1X_017564 [Malus domestica]